ncbi:MAG: peptidylprolyl isomerase [Patescibacteria group bacterium]|nr:peptidylprolyl isomerase [Patescibacteria group bacterium]
MEQNFESPVLGNKKENKKNKFWIILGIILAVVLLGFLFWKFGLSGNVGGRISKSLPIPSARVNGSFVMQSKLEKNYQALKFFYDSQEGQSEEKISDLDIKKMALDRLIEDKVVSQLSEKYNIKISKEDIEKEYKLVLEDYDTEDELAKEIKSLYDMSISEFKKEVLEPSLMYDKLQKSYLMDDKIDKDRKAKSEEAKKKAEDALAKLKAGKDFAELAKEVSQDKSTKKDGGNLGFIGKDEMETEFEIAAFKLNVGETSEIVRTIEGFHIIKVDKKKGSGDDEQVKASHIFFKVEDDFDKWFLDQKKKAKIKIYVKDIKWNKEQATIEGLNLENTDTTADDVEIEDVEVEPVK